jgi:ubiquinol-cytochrome c reductase cytochrome c subunit
MSMTPLRTILIGVLVIAAATLGAASLSAQPSTPTGDAKRGQHLFVVQGCYECHNYQGQGTGSRGPRQNPGPNLAPAPIPYAAFVTQMRMPRAVMPSYDARLLSDRDLADIYAYLAAQRPGKDARSIALLAAVSTGSTSGAKSTSSRGAEVYAANCAACHGASGQGGATGPTLIGEKARKDTNALIAFIKNPAPPMPKLYPGVLTDNDVAAVAAYIESLH